MAPMPVSQPVENPDGPPEIRGEGLFGFVAERVEALPCGNEALAERIQLDLIHGNEGEILEGLVSCYLDRTRNFDQNWIANAGEMGDHSLGGSA